MSDRLSNKAGTSTAISHKVCVPGAVDPGRGESLSAAPAGINGTPSVASHPPPSSRWPQVTEPPGIPVGVARRSHLQRVGRTASDAVQHRPSHSHKHGVGHVSGRLHAALAHLEDARQGLRWLREGPCRRVRKPGVDLPLVHFSSVGGDSQPNEQADGGNEIDAPEAMLMILVQSFWEELKGRAGNRYHPESPYLGPGGFQPPALPWGAIQRRGES